MRLQKVKEALERKRISYQYTEEDGCGSLDFLFRGLKYHVWEFYDGEPGSVTECSGKESGSVTECSGKEPGSGTSGWGAETNVFNAGRSEDLEGDYEEQISREILFWPDMIA